ncbi:hypothetical protein AVEN_227848-1, partial [Araneus ventricosus]
MSHATDVVAKPTICSWDLVDRIYVLINFSVENFSYLQPQLLPKSEKSSTPLILMVIMQDKGRRVPKSKGRYLPFSGVMFFFTLPLWRHHGLWCYEQWPGPLSERDV